MSKPGSGAIKRYVKHLDWFKALTIDRYLLRDVSRRERWRLTIVATIGWLKLERYLDAPLLASSDWLFYKSLERADYKKLYRQIADCCEDGESQIHSSTVGKRTHWLNVLKIPWLCRRSVAAFWHEGIPNSLFLCIRTWGYVEAIQHLSDLDVVTLVVFADMQPADHLLVQIYRLRNIPTVALQHGLYVDYGSFENINTANYDNAIADTLLVWGEQTATLIRRHHPNIDCIVCGKPLTRLTPEPTPRGIEPYLTLLFDQNLFEDQNRELLYICRDAAAALGLGLNLRLHPNNRPEQYELANVTHRTDLPIEASAFVVGHTTSMIIECLALGIPAYQYRTEIPATALPAAQRFADAAELIAKAGAADATVTPQSIAAYIACIGTASRERYSAAFRSLLEQSRSRVDRTSDTAQADER